MMFNITMEEGYRKLFGRPIEKQKLLLFKEFKNLLIEKNKVMNLTTITEDKEIAIKHFLDSLTLLLLDSYPSGKDKIIDVGTGGGFPGIPLKIMEPDLDITLLDSLKKRVDFLKETGDTLGFHHYCPLHGRAEDMGRDNNYRERYDYGVSRAVAPLPTLLEYTLPFIKVGGSFLCQKGPGIFDELEDSKRALKVLGGEVSEIKEIALPFAQRRHQILVVKKSFSTPEKYPRQPGKPSKKPII